MAYEFIHRNLPQALPSLRTVETIVQSQYSHIEEGKFRFDEVLRYLTEHNLPLLVSVAEDATRVVKRVEYDPASNRCVGFVIPFGKDGELYKAADQYKAISFAGIQAMFENSRIANYAYVYTIQPLKEGAPSFCLACVGTDNTFTASEVLQTWIYIVTELRKRRIQVYSFAADGDSRLLRAMRIVMNMSSDSLSTEINMDKLGTLSNNTQIPTELHKWLYVNQIPPVLCVQDTVHIGVKLKSRLLKPSIRLPMGSYIACSSHLHILMKSYGKAKHGLRIKDLNHQDKQNFDAVQNIIKASPLLDRMADAVGTRHYIGIIQSVVDSYLDKGLSPEKRLHDMWYAVFLLRYWRQWIVKHQTFTLRDNFITSNAYMCIEINAHSLLMFILLLKDSNADASFVPWLYGSQSCERMFRALRSMTGTFSTIINFNMLGLLRRLHKLYIQEQLQTEACKAEHGITFPRQENFGRRKEGSNSYELCPLDEVAQPKKVVSVFQKALEKARDSVEELGMADCFKEDGEWTNPVLVESLRGLVIENDSEDEDEQENKGKRNEVSNEKSGENSKTCTTEKQRGANNVKRENELKDKQEDKDGENSKTCTIEKQQKDEVNNVKRESESKNEPEEGKHGKNSKTCTTEQQQKGEANLKRKNELKKQEEKQGENSKICSQQKGEANYMKRGKANLQQVTAGASKVNENDEENELMKDLEVLHGMNVIDNAVKTRAKSQLSSKQKHHFGDIGIPMYVNKPSANRDCQNSENSLFVKVNIGDENVLIRKQTVVWLFQETERVSSDRLFRVRAKQPHSNGGETAGVSTKAAAEDALNPVRSDYITIGDLCIFQVDNTQHDDTQSSSQSQQVCIGKVIQFVAFEKGKQRPFKGNHASVSGNYGVLCTWYTATQTCTPFESGTYEVCKMADFNYYHINTYVRTITKGCLLTTSPNEAEIGFQSSVLIVGSSFTITDACQEYIIQHQTLMATMAKQNALSTTSKDDLIWVQYDNVILHTKDKNTITSGNKLSDLHINAAQCILQNQFKNVTGLQNTLLQKKYPLRKMTNCCIQILHVRSDHWAVATTIGLTETSPNLNVIRYYDSAYSTISDDTEDVLLNLFSPSKFQLRVEVMATPKQGGSTDCGLYAIAIATALAHGKDPCQLIFRQEEMRQHFLDCIQSKKLHPFPIRKQIRTINNIKSQVTLYLCPVCAKPDSGELMVGCDKCANWFHNSCIPPYDSSQEWHCPNCTRRD